MKPVREKDLDQLVDVIARRVEAELARRQPPPPAPAAAGPCAACPAVPSVAGCPSGCAGAHPTGNGGETPACAHVAPLIDHTLLKPEATKEELKRVCEEAKRYRFKTVCVNSANIAFVARLLNGSPVIPIAVVGFPLGAALTSAKVFETRESIRGGAREIDMVLNIGALKSKDFGEVLRDIQAVVEVAGAVPVKVILETSKLERDEKVIACALAKAAGAAFVKTSTGFGGGGATPEDIALMRSVVGPEMGVKASGGVRTIDDAEAMVQAGADRLGASSSVAIVKCERSAKPDASQARAPKGY